MGQLDEIHFRTALCDMIQLEVVTRREAHGSFPERNPHIPKRHVFSKLVLEYFLKTKDCVWDGQRLPADDPYIVFENETAKLYHPHAPLHSQEPFLVLDTYPLKGELERFHDIKHIMLRSTLVLEKMWQILSYVMVDIKCEFGFTRDRRVVLADEIDNGSWRLLDKEGRNIDKQRHREGEPIEAVMEGYEHVARLTERFSLPRQRLIIWRTSSSDDVTPFVEQAKPLEGNEFMSVVTPPLSLHKRPIQAIETLHRMIQEVPDSVIITYVGRSNGAGPTLSANSTVPVISVPANWREFPEDVWSSLRTPSDTPALTVLDPKNAVLAALQILAMRNPRLYADLRMQQEERFTNFGTF
ncbi:MAG: AIR carboxylase family protein [Parcubacteria group bacterium]|nr:AIR carboxylase family protein [Parcubacteria group bacterium]